MLSDRDLLRKLGSTGAAFFGQFQSLREIQRQAIPPILLGKNVLLSSATASGKTEAVFAPLVAKLREKQTGGEGIRLLAIAPTRALVNDLHSRLEYPLSNIQWTCGRQTSDHRDKTRKPNLLITTPESFDSMLVRDGDRCKGALKGHLLAGVQAVFIDEAHLFDASVRGDQLVWLLARLQRLREHAFSRNWTNYKEIQICAASATVASPGTLAAKLLGSSAEIVQVPGRREIEIFSVDGGSRWVGIDALGSVQEIYEHILRARGPEDIQFLSDSIWQAVRFGGIENTRKVLVFVTSRALCDSLSAHLAKDLRRRRDIWIGGHHASLERSIRENAEREFANRRDAILVATTTLEVGIDIGDVDAVALIGSPQDTASLLQRVGRAGRRSGCVRIIPIAREEIEARALASMLEAACRGILDERSSGRRWSVCVQQAVSFILQSGGTGRRRSDIVALADQVWPELRSPSSVSRILDGLVEEELLVRHGDRLFLGDGFSDQFERGDGSLHSNFEGDATGIPVVDASTGEIVAHVAQFPSEGQPIALAGQKWDVIHQSGEILLRTTRKDHRSNTFQYTFRTAPCGKIFAEHVRRGLGLAEDDAPVVPSAEGLVWFHFGGSAYDAVLRKILSSLRTLRGLAGIALRGIPDDQTISALINNPQKIQAVIETLGDSMAPLLSPGRFHNMLPADIRTSVMIDLFEVQVFIKWLGSRKIRELRSPDPIAQQLLAVR